MYNKDIIAALIDKMIEYETGKPDKTGHFLKVYGFAQTIGLLEKLTEEEQFTLELAAIVHDIGINPSIEKYKSSAGKYQETEGPPIAEKMLEEFDISHKIKERVCFLVGHHHTYSGVEGVDWQILLEADFLVNMLEENMSENAIKFAYDKVFKTPTGRKFCEKLYLNKD
ncbi:MAG: HD domain-containing protein [Oscillospiraceae bacterium]|jgi:HD superfamily phosphodiesterase|nr:HD domain-containing protein [Oscillospiraceae bacterium]